MHLDDVLMTVRGDPIRVADVVTLLKIRRFFRSAIYELIERRVVFAHAERLALVSPLATLHSLRNRMRESLGLADPIVFQSFLRDNGITI